MINLELWVEKDMFQIFLVEHKHMMMSVTTIGQTLAKETLIYWH